MDATHIVQSTALLNHETRKFLPAIMVGEQCLCVFDNRPYDSAEAAYDKAAELLHETFEFLMSKGAKLAPDVSDEVGHPQGNA